MKDPNLKQYRKVSQSILNHLPWVEFDNRTETVLLQDATVVAAFELSLATSEAKPESYLEQLRDGLQGLFQDTFPQYCDGESPWILQFYIQDELSMAYLYQSIENLHYACPNHTGDWYFTGNYPTPGGNRVVNNAFINFYEGNKKRAY